MSENEENSLVKKLKIANIAARKAKDEVAVSALGGLIDQAQKLAKAADDPGKREINDEYVLLAARRETAAAREELDGNVKAGRTEKAAAIQSKIEILKAFMPEEISMDELRKVIRDIAAGNEAIGANPRAGMGIVIGELKARYGTRYDSKAMSPVVKEVLGA